MLSGIEPGDNKKNLRREARRNFGNKKSTKVSFPAKKKLASL
jgi:hypothetical protein